MMNIDIAKVTIIPPKFLDKPLSEETQKKITLSQSECETQNKRDVKCPYCGQLIYKVFGDIQGHLEMKCPKCKAVTPINLAYFRRAKKYRRRSDLEFQFDFAELMKAN